MQFLLYPHLLVNGYAALLPLNLLGDKKEEAAPVESGERNETFVDQCLTWLDRFETRKPAAA